MNKNFELSEKELETVSGGLIRPIIIHDKPEKDKASKTREFI